jgi:hypothetical protein
MNQKHLLRFIKKKLRTCPDEEVIVRNGQVLTLAQACTYICKVGCDAVFPCCFDAWGVGVLPLCIHGNLYQAPRIWFSSRAVEIS